MTATLRRLVALAPPPWARLALSVILGAAAVVCGIGLMATAGYLIARAAERPAVLSLTTAIVAVRFFGLGRPVARYLERLAAHDVAFRLLARIRVRFYERIEPLAPAELHAFRKGDLLARMVGDVDALQSVYLRGLGPAMVGLAVGAASVAVAAAILPEPRSSWRPASWPAPPSSRWSAGGWDERLPMPPPPGERSAPSSSSCCAVPRSSSCAARKPLRWRGSVRSTARSPGSPGATGSRRASRTG